MNKNFIRIQNKLKKYNQEHLLRFYDELTNDKKKKLVSQLKCIDLKEIDLLYKKSMIDKNISLNNISPMEYIDKEQLTKKQIELYKTIGEDVIRKKQFAIVTLAGGQGSRLGGERPKGCYELNIKDNKKSLFEINFENIKRARKKYGIMPFWLIMTSQDNDLETRRYFKKKKYFDYNRDKIIFFRQNKEPILSLDGKIVLENKYSINQAANGNGDVFEALRRYDLINRLKNNNVKYVFFSGIDNILVNPFDLVFLGLMVDKNYEIASKSIFKRKPLEKQAVFCKINNVPSILEYKYIDNEISNLKNEEKNFLYRDKNIVSHLMTIEAIEKVSKVKLEYHRVYKLNTCINSDGIKVKEKLLKFEKFIFDAFNQFDDMLLLRVNNEKEFAPIKSSKDIDNAINKYNNYWNLRGDK